jgi:uncharacterized repeat protein (TIGR03843 family)
VGDPAQVRDAAEPAHVSGADLDAADVLTLLRDGELTLEGRLVDASNATLFGTVSDGERAVHAVYKPVRGERPLWDVPDGTLAGREVASYLVSAATPWAFVPPTVLRDGPFGVGMVQAWIDADEDADLVELVNRRHDQRLRQIALLDVVLNNADRKGGHLLPVPDGRIYGCDHGLTFSVEDKLRTVLWQWRGKPLADDERDVLRGLATALTADLGAVVAELINDVELAATIGRIEELLSRGRFPQPAEHRPPVPWPPF